MSGITLLQDNNWVNFDKVSKINFDYLFIWIDWFWLWSLFNFNSVHINAVFLLLQIMAHPNITLNLEKLDNLTLMIKLSVMQINSSLLKYATKPSTYWRSPSNKLLKGINLFQTFIFINIFYLININHDYKCFRQRKIHVVFYCVWSAALEWLLHSDWARKNLFLATPFFQMST